MLSGTLLVGWGNVWNATRLVEIRAGEKLEVPADVIHFTGAREDTVMEVKVAGPYNIEYVLDADDPRQQKR